MTRKIASNLVIQAVLVLFVQGFREFPVVSLYADAIRYTDADWYALISARGTYNVPPDLPLANGVLANALIFAQVVIASLFLTIKVFNADAPSNACRSNDVGFPKSTVVNAVHP